MKLEKIEKLHRMITTSTNTVVLSGAGISTESGIPDYRSPNTGLWEKMDQSIVSLEGFLNNPQKYYTFALELYPTRSKAEPNIAHIMLAKLEKEGLVSGVITQNVDGLHKKAGSKNVYELHGSLREVICLNCREQESMDAIIEGVKKGKNPPVCKKCEGLLKPKAVFFGEGLPEEEWKSALNLLERADFLMVLGTSLQVYPVNQLPRVALGQGAKMAIINIQDTPFDVEADLVIQEKIGEVFSELRDLYNKKK